MTAEKSQLPTNTILILFVEICFPGCIHSGGGTLGSLHDVIVTCEVIVELDGNG